MAEVTEGLEVGDEVLMHVDERLLAKLPAPSTVQHDAPHRSNDTTHATKERQATPQKSSQDVPAEQVTPPAAAKATPADVAASATEQQPEPEDTDQAHADDDADANTSAAASDTPPTSDS